MKNPHDPNNKALSFFRLVSMFLSGSVFGVAGFAFWADSAEILVPNPLFRILFPIGIAVAAIIALLPDLVAQIYEGLRKMKSSSRTIDSDKQRV